ncbi:MAG: hypothetical protein PHY93_06315 [Bacteriovorax sp.]|nr:hypothetical protein [Bacteriovorax sp.]
MKKIKKNNLTFLSTALALTIFVSMNNSYAATPSTTSGIYFPTPITTSPPATTTTTTGAAPTSTSGLMIPLPGASAVSPGVNPAPATINSPTATPVCVDSGVQGRRCGIEAVTFCKLNPEAQNCETLNNAKGDAKK